VSGLQADRFILDFGDAATTANNAALEITPSLKLGTLILLGTDLLGLGGFARRKMSS